MRFRLAADRQAPTAARASLMGLLDVEMPEPARDAAALMITEVVANAVLHGCSSVRDQILVEVRAGGGTVGIAVRDPGACTGDPAAGREGDGYRDDGFGLAIVDQLATRWGMEREPANTVVWFELATAG